MEDSLGNWISHLEMEEEHQNHSSFDEQQFLREILEQPENLSPYYPCSTLGIVEGGGGGTSPTNSTLSFDETSFCGNDHDHATLHKSNSSNSIKSLERCNCSGSTYLLSFDNSFPEPIMLQPKAPKLNSPLGSNKRTVVKDGYELEPSMAQSKKKVRRVSETKDHIMAERKRRQELTGSIIALSATIPGLKKMDKAYVLREAVNYTKQLQERIKELENEKKDKRVDSAIVIKKSQANSNKSTGNCNKESVFEVEARVLEKEVLIGIHCEKQKDTVFKIHALLEKLHLSITSSSVLPFGSSILIINIIAQMESEYSMSTNELVKNLKEYLLEA
ncbi:hypothetical protein VNO77_21109 [Canavalia gladiata]|uniref:BHLH domain-containing protein n=1 Tax=Canavalia gladiata TaxID=3824 RepID=A0AAN9LQP0_CANGL